MKKIVMILFIAAMTAVSANAQEKKQEAPSSKKTPEERAENMTKRLSKELALSAEQEAKVKELILKREKQRAEGMKKAKEEMEKVDAEFKTIFTAEQYQKFEKKKEEMKAKRKENQQHRHKEGNGSTPPPAQEQK